MRSKRICLPGRRSVWVSIINLRDQRKQNEIEFVEFNYSSLSCIISTGEYKIIENQVHYFLLRIPSKADALFI